MAAVVAIVTPQNHPFFFFIKTQSLNKFNDYHKILFIFTQLCSRSQGLICLLSYKFLPLNNISATQPTPAPGNHHFTVFTSLAFLHSTYSVISYNICLSLCDLPHSARCPQRPSKVVANGRFSVSSQLKSIPLSTSHPPLSIRSLLGIEHLSLSWLL